MRLGINKETGLDATQQADEQSPSVRLLQMISQPAHGRRFLVVLGPLVVTNVLQALSGTANTMYIGHTLGVDALASVSGFVPLLLLLMSFVIGLGAGASILVGQAWGG